MTHYLYIIRLLGVPIYIGVTKNPITRFQKHHRSKKPVGKILRKYGEQAAWIEILAAGSRNYIYDTEVKAIKAFGTRHPTGFNIGAGGWGCRDPLPSTRAKMSKSIGERMRSPEVRAKMAVSRKGNTNCVGRVVSPETRAKISAGHIGQTRSAESRTKQSEARLGRPHSPKHKAALSEAAKRRWARTRALQGTVDTGSR